MLKPTPQHARTPAPITWIGRYHPAWEWVERNVRHYRRSPLKALVIGIGGGRDTNGQLHRPAEPVELGLALHRAKIPFSMTAADVRAEPIEQLKRQLQDGHITFSEFAPPKPLIVGKLWEAFQARWKYLGKLVGKEFESGTHRIELPENVQKSIKTQGPERRGDLFAPSMPKNNDLVSIMNVAMYYDDHQQKKLAERAFGVLRTGGTLITHTKSGEDAFLKQLRILFGPNGRIHQEQSLEGGTIHIFVKQPPRRRRVRTS